MATDLLLDSDLDIDLTTAGGALVTGIDELVQRLRVSLGYGRGESWTQSTWGLDFRGTWLGANVDLRLCEADLRAQLGRMPGIGSVRSVALTRSSSTRRTTVTFEIVATSNQVIVVTASGDPSGLPDALSIVVDGALYAALSGLAPGL